MQILKLPQNHLEASTKEETVKAIHECLDMLTATPFAFESIVTMDSMRRGGLSAIRCEDGQKCKFMFTPEEALYCHFVYLCGLYKEASGSRLGVKSIAEMLANNCESRWGAAKQEQLDRTKKKG